MTWWGNWFGVCGGDAPLAGAVIAIDLSIADGLSLALTQESLYLAMMPEVDVDIELVEETLDLEVAADAAFLLAMPNPSGIDIAISGSGVLGLEVISCP